MFLMNPAPLLAPELTPLFLLDLRGTPLRHSRADSMFQWFVKATFPSLDPTRWSLHSLRIGAASALLAAGASVALIQAMCRWRSTNSIEIYARLGPADYWKWVTHIQSQAVDSITALRLPRIDWDSIVSSLNRHTETGEDALIRLADQSK